MFAMSTTLWALDITDILKGLRKTLIDTDGTISERSAEYSIELNSRVIIQTTIFSIEVCFKYFILREHGFTYIL